MEKDHDVLYADLFAKYQEQAKQIEELSAALAAKDEALRIAEKVLGNGYRGYVTEALAIQPHASLVAKIRADAVRMFSTQYGHSIEAEEFAQRIEKGEE